jgi:predicted Zn-dependent protease
LRQMPPACRRSNALIATIFRFCFATLFIVPLFLASGSVPVAEAQQLQRVYLVPLDEVAEPNIDELAAYYRERYGIPVEVLPQLEIGITEVDVDRRQVVAEELIRLMRASYPNIAADGASEMIGITRHFMYPRGMPQWQWAFAWRTDNRFAAVSTFAMDPLNYREPADPEILATRLRKMVTKTIAVQFYGLPLNSDPTSILYDSILGLDDLDRVGEDLPLA